MYRLNNDWFINAPYMDLDFIYAVRIMHGSMYLLGYMENAETYKIQKMENVYDCKINTLLLEKTNFKDVICHVNGWNSTRREYVLHDGACIEPESYVNARDMFLQCVEPVGQVYEKNIFLFDSTRDLNRIVDVLKDGDYIFIIQE